MRKGVDKNLQLPKHRSQRTARKSRHFLLAAMWVTLTETVHKKNCAALQEYQQVHADIK